MSRLPLPPTDLAIRLPGFWLCVVPLQLNAEMLGDGVGDLRLDFAGKGVAVDTPGLMSVVSGQGGEGLVVVPTGRGRSFSLGRAFVGDADGGRIGREGRDNPGGQAVAVGRADNSWPNLICPATPA